MRNLKVALLAALLLGTSTITVNMEAQARRGWENNRGHHYGWRNNWNNSGWRRDHRFLGHRRDWNDRFDRGWNSNNYWQWRRWQAAQRYGRWW